MIGYDFKRLPLNILIKVSMKWKVTSQLKLDAHGGLKLNIGNINKTSSSQRKIFTTTKMNVFLHFHIKQFLRLLQYNRRVRYLKKIKKRYKNCCSGSFVHNIHLKKGSIHYVYTTDFQIMWQNCEGNFSHKTHKKTFCFRDKRVWKEWKTEKGQSGRQMRNLLCLIL